MEKITRHHMLWCRRDYTTRLEKSVRGLYIYPAPLPNHQLLHLLIPPPEKPHHHTLQLMRDLAYLPLEQVIEQLNDPIAEHLDRQLSILTLPTKIALDRLEGTVHA